MTDTVPERTDPLRESAVVLAFGSIGFLVSSGRWETLPLVAVALPIVYLVHLMVEIPPTWLLPKAWWRR